MMLAISCMPSMQFIQSAPAVLEKGRTERRRARKRRAELGHLSTYRALLVSTTCSTSSLTYLATQVALSR